MWSAGPREVVRMLCAMGPGGGIELRLNLGLENGLYLVQAFLTLGLCMKTIRRMGYMRPNKPPIVPPIMPPIAPGAASCEYPYAPDVISIRFMMVPRTPQMIANQP